MRKAARSLARPIARRAAIHSTLAVGLLSGAAASAQEAETALASPAGDEADGGGEIIVTGERRSAALGADPIAVFDENAIAATGATNIGELLRAIRGVTQSADGSEPIFLLNAQRVSGYQEIGSLPPEAIEKVEVMPEPTALRFGFPPTRRVVNFITKRRFRQIQVRGAVGSTTRSGSMIGNADVGLTRLHNDSRLTVNLESRHTGALLQSERDIGPDPDLLFDAIGNLSAPGGGEIDPALSALAGQPVRVVAVPEAAADRATLGGFAAGANRPRLFDPGPYRTLASRNDSLKGEAVLGGQVTETIAGTFSLSGERSRDRGLAGPAVAILNVPASNPHAPFAGDVLLHRYLTEVDPLRQQRTTTTLHAGGTVRGAVAGWRWDFSAALDQQHSKGFSERGIDLEAVNDAIAAGLDPFAPLPPSLLQARLVDHAKLRTRTAGAKTVVTSKPLRLPAGEATVTATVEAEHGSASSSTRGPNPYDLQLSRTRKEAGIAADLPLASRRLGVLPFVGELSVNASANARHVGGFGALYDATYGLTWAPVRGLQFIALARHSAAAPGMTDLATPVVRLANVPVFDLGNGRTEVVDVVQGGNPDLDAEHRRVRSLGISLKPFAKRELRMSATYEATSIENQTGTIYALTPEIEAILPDLVSRDSSGRLVSVTYQPRNFYRERQRVLNMTFAASGSLGKPPPPLPPGATGPQRPRPNYYVGAGPSIKFSDHLQLKRDAPEFDLLGGETINGGGTARVYGYAYGGLNHFGNGANFDFWYGGANRVRGDTPATDLRFASIFKLNVSAFISVHHFLRDQEWTRRLQLKLEVRNVTDDRPRVRDGNGRVPNRYQADYLDPVGRTVTFSVRKLF